MLMAKTMILSSAEISGRDAESPDARDQTSDVGNEKKDHGVEYGESSEGNNWL